MLLCFASRFLPQMHFSNTAWHLKGGGGLGNEQRLNFIQSVHSKYKFKNLGTI